MWKAKKNLKYDPWGNLNRYLYVEIKYRNIPKKLSVLHRWKIRNRNNLTSSFTFYAPDMQLWIKFLIQSIGGLFSYKNITEKQKLLP